MHRTKKNGSKKTYTEGKQPADEEKQVSASQAKITGIHAKNLMKLLVIQV
jgi:hypothetical protein